MSVSVCVCVCMSVCFCVCVFQCVIVLFFVYGRWGGGREGGGDLTELHVVHPYYNGCVRDVS